MKPFHSKRPLWPVFVVGIASFITIALDAKVAWSGGPEVIDLISPATCRQQLGRFLGCTIPSHSVALPTIESAVPLRTRVRRIRSGDCTTQYSLELSVTARNQASVRFPYVRDSELVLRRPDGGAIDVVTIADASPYTKVLVVADSCRFSLQISPNEVDIDSKEQAAKFIEHLQGSVAEKTAECHRYQRLAINGSANAFLRAVAESFLTELTSDSMIRLRASAQESVASLAQLTGATGISDDDRRNIMTLMVVLPQLGGPDLRVDGTPKKTLSDFIGPTASDVLATAERLSKRSNPHEVTDDAAYQCAAVDLERLTDRLTLAQAQLAHWLNP